MKEINLKNGSKILLDDEDYNFVSELLDRGFTFRINKKNNVNITGQLHRLVTKFQLDDNLQIDHIDRNPLNNQKSNLRLATASQNGANKAKYKNRVYTSIYKGVLFSPKLKKYVARIKYHRKPIHLGVFNEEKDAAIAYDIKALELFGEFACLNFSSISQEDKSRVINQLNNPKKRAGSSKYIGVTFHSASKKFRAYIYHNGNQIFLGSFYNEEDAALIRDNKAIELFGDKAKLNFSDYKL